MATSTERRITFFFKIGLFVLIAKLTKSIDLLVYDFHRTTEQQAERYAKGRTKPGKIITNCDGRKRKSKHQSWLAVDFVIVKDGKLIWKYVPEYDVLAGIWRSLGGTCGIDFKTKFLDPYHFQL